MEPNFDNIPEKRSSANLSDGQKEKAYRIMLDHITEDLMPLTKAMKQRGAMSYNSFTNYVDASPVRVKEYTRAREIRQECIFDNMREVANTPIIGETRTTKHDGKVETTKGDMLGHRRLMIDTDKWILGKLNSPKYGDRVINQHEGEINTGPKLDFSQLTTAELMTFKKLYSKATIIEINDSK